MQKHKTDITCNICGDKFSTGWCKTQLGRYLKKRILEYKHNKNKHKT